MRIVSLLSLISISIGQKLPQHRVRRSTRAVGYHHILHKGPKPNAAKFWIPSSDSLQHDHPRKLHDVQRIRLGEKEFPKAKTVPKLQFDNSASHWFVHIDASKHSPEDVYNKHKREHVTERSESDAKSMFWSVLGRRRRAQEVDDPFAPGQEEDTSYALGEKDSGYTAGNTDLVYDDAMDQTSSNDTTAHTWNVSTEVEYGRPEEDYVNTTNSTSSQVYTTTDTNETMSFQPIRIRAILSEQGDGGEFLTQKERTVLFQEILSPAIVAWSAALRVDPVIGNLTVDATQLYDGETCGPGKNRGYPSVAIPSFHLADGIPDTDIVVYLSLAFVTEPTTLIPFSEDLTGSSSRNTTNTSTEAEEGPVNSSRSNGSWSTLGFGEDNSSTNSSKEEPVNSSSSNGSWSTYGFGEDDKSKVEWPSCSGDYLAAATYCSTDQYDRPTAALLHLCIDDSFFLQKSWERDITTVMHELGHALGFNTQSMAHFRRSDGTPITARKDGDVVDSLVECTGSSHIRRSEVLPLPSEEILQFRMVRGVRVAEVVTPSVRQVVRNHFDCQTLAGAELESGNVLFSNATNVTREEGAVSDEEVVASCIGDHWEKRLFRIDLMNPVVDEITFSLRFSPITLALFADSGWYQVDLSRTTFSASWGRAAGCGFVNDTCVGEYGEVTEVNKAFFCNEVTLSSKVIDGIHGCSPDLLRKAACSMSQYDFQLPQEYQYFNDTLGSNVGGSEPLLDYCPVYNGFANGLCKESENQHMLQVNQIEMFGVKNSRCVRGIVDEHATALCLSIACVIEDRTLRVKVNEHWNLCRYSGQLIPVYGDKQSHVICPDPVRTCPTFYCHRDCLGTGGICNYTSGACFCSKLTENGTITGKCFEIGDLPEVFYDDDNHAKPLDDSSISDYYFLTKRALEGESGELEAWMIAVIIIGGMLGIVLLALCLQRAWSKRSASEGDSIWFRRPHDTDDAAAVAESSPNSDKDKFVASMLVMMRVNDPLSGRMMEDSQAESITETENSFTETESSGQFTKGSEAESLDESDRRSDASIDLSDVEYRNEHSEVPASVMRKRVILDAS